MPPDGAAGVQPIVGARGSVVTRTLLGCRHPSHVDVVEEHVVAPAMDGPTAAVPHPITRSPRRRTFETPCPSRCRPTE